jgi:hypothetical protein
MTNGGKDIKLGHDKRPVSVVPSQENLYNIFNGEILTDAFGQPLFADKEIIFINDALSERSTSVVFPTKTNPITIKDLVSVGNTTVDYNFVGTNKIGITTSNSEFSLNVGDRLSGKYIPNGTIVSRIGVGSVFLSNNPTNTTSTSEENVEIIRKIIKKGTFTSTLKIQEQFPESSEVSSSILGIPRAETQLSLFSDVGSYGLDDDEWETVKFFGSNKTYARWLKRKNKIYGNRFEPKLSEEVNESALKLEAFPPPYKYPFGPNFDIPNLNSYDPERFQEYLKFVRFGNQLYNYYDEFGSKLGYPSDWKENFLPENVARVVSGDVEYNEDINFAFARIDDWTETWRDMRDSQLIDPVTKKFFTFIEASKLSTVEATSSSNSRPGYGSDYISYIILQSKKSFRYQPGKVSGFTFGVRSSAETSPGYVNEFGIFNESDEYIFRVKQGTLSVVRRSSIPLSDDVLFRNLLSQNDQKLTASSDVFNSTELFEVEISRDKFNGDSLNGNGPSGYTLQIPNVTMYKIEFGWYGAIGVRFYVYIPAGSGEARWVVLHTLIIENQLGQPCLRDSNFKFKYQILITDNAFLRKPVFLYKYGSSCYIDGGDEGFFKSFDAKSKVKFITNTSGPQTFFGLVPKRDIKSSTGDLINNNMITIPTKITVNSDSLVKVDIIKCDGCPDGFGYTYGPGVATTENGRTFNVRVVGPKTIEAIGDNYFYNSDIGAKLISNTIWSTYIEELKNPVGIAGSFTRAVVNRDIQGRLVNDSGITTTIGGNGTEYSHPVRISNYDGMFVSDYKITGSKVVVEFMNPVNRDQGSNSANQVSNFRIGFTNAVSDIDDVDGNIFKVGGIATSILPEERFLFAECKENSLRLSENGIEIGETVDSPFTTFEVDTNIEKITTPGGGVCSRMTLTVEDSQEISNVSYTTKNPIDGKIGDFLQVNGTLPPLAINQDGNDEGYTGGNITISDSNGNPKSTNLTYIGITSAYIPDPAKPKEINTIIEISGDISTIDNPPYTLLFTPIKLEFSDSALTTTTKRTIFNFNPFPLFFVAQLKDYGAINSIILSETIGLNKKTVSIVESKSSYSTKLSLTDASGNADLIGLSPPNFTEVDRLSSLQVDISNQQKLRSSFDQSRIVDTFYVGANDPKTVDLSKIFNSDRYTILPSRKANQAYFVVAENISSNNSATVEMSINYKE